jgi:hypothetical protein
VSEQQPLRVRVVKSAAQLAVEFEGVFSPQTVEKCALESFDSYEGARVAEFVPLLVYRETRERLLAMSRTSSSSGTAAV